VQAAFYFTGSAEARADLPIQYRANIVRHALSPTYKSCGCKPIFFEIREDADGELVTAWKSTKEEEQSYAENV
jgi:hypothetical protein